MAGYGHIEVNSNYNSIAKFYDSIQKNEFARKFQFKVGTLGPLSEEHLIYITTAEIPQRQISNVTAPFMGVDFNIPGSVKYSGSAAWNVTFRCDEAANIRALLLAWQDEIFNVQQSGGKYGVPTEKAVIYQLSKDIQVPTRKFILQGIYPTEIGSMQYDMGDNGTIQTFNATFAYQFWYEEAAV